MNPQIFRSSNKRRTGRDSEIHLFFFFFLKIFSAGYVVLFFFFLTFSIYVSETDAPSLPTRVCYEWPAVAALAQIHPGGLLQGGVLLGAAQ